MATDPKEGTSAYSATKAPDTRDHAEEKKTVRDERLQPGGAHAAPVAQGMAALERDEVPSRALKDEKQRTS